MKRNYKDPVVGSEVVCSHNERRARARAEDWNGLDYLDVGDDRRTLTVYFLGKAPRNRHIGKENLRVDGGRRVRDVSVANVTVCPEGDPQLDDCMQVTLDKAGDLSTYTLRIVEAGEHGKPGDVPMQGFDPLYSSLDFSFKVNCPGDLDCVEDELCPPDLAPEPSVNYLAKDYASFRELIFDRLSLIMPGWQERHVPDLGVTLVELLAYAGDYLSYYQDAVATEAYLDTARQRISVRRHVRLMDYRMHEGCNARAWLHLQTDKDQDLNPSDVYFITNYNNTLELHSRVVDADDLRFVQKSDYEVFEPVLRDAINLYEAHNSISFWSWGDEECCIPKGATAATLKDGWVEDMSTQPGYERYKARQAHANKPGEGSEEQATPRLLDNLQVGDVLIFEEVKGPNTGKAADADPSHRHAVCLTRVERDVDALYNQPVVNIEWAPEDALPFPLCLSSLAQPGGERCERIDDVSVARGNVILVDQGRTLAQPEDLPPVPTRRQVAECIDDCWPPEITETSGRYRPRLRELDLTFSQPLASYCPASQALKQDPRQALPQVLSLVEHHASLGANGRAWEARYDLLASESESCHFAVEMDNEGYAHLRMGNGESGCAPTAGAIFRARYRVGNGVEGNVGAEVISHVVRRNATGAAGLLARNPLPAIGGTNAEPLDRVKLFAPATFRRQLKRAVTAPDYSSLVNNPQGLVDGSEVAVRGVQAVATEIRWLGSWYEARVSVDPLGREFDSDPPSKRDAALLKSVEDYLEPYRRIGHDLEVVPARYVPLLIGLEVCVLPHYLQGHVEAALLGLLTSRAGRDGTRGFFHPDNLSFGKSIYAGELIALVQQVPGVESVKIAQLERMFEGPAGELEAGVLQLGPLEIARVDNDPSFPENGTLTLTMLGGR
jgi:hypothetical protein